MKKGILIICTMKRFTDFYKDHLLISVFVEPPPSGCANKSLSWTSPSVLLSARRLASDAATGRCTTQQQGAAAPCSSSAGRCRKLHGPAPPLHLTAPQAVCTTFNIFRAIAYKLLYILNTPHF